MSVLLVNYETQITNGQEICSVCIRKDAPSAYTRFAIQNELTKGCVDGKFYQENETLFFVWNRNKYCSLENACKSGRWDTSNGRAVLRTLRKVILARMDTEYHFLAPNLFSLETKHIYCRVNGNGNCTGEIVLEPVFNEQENSVLTPDVLMRELSAFCTEDVWNHYLPRAVREIEEDRGMESAYRTLNRIEKELYERKNPLD